MWRSGEVYLGRVWSQCLKATIRSVVPLRPSAVPGGRVTSWFLERLNKKQTKGGDGLQPERQEGAWAL